MTAPTVSSTPVLRTTLLWSAVATGILAIAGAVIGFAVAGWSGLWSALIAILLAAVFLGFTGATILIANRWFGDPLYVPIFFGSVMGGWILKFVVFIVVLIVLRGQPWLNATVFFVALVVSVVLSLVIDVVVMLRMRMPHASDVSLPTLADVIDEARGPRQSESPEGLPEEGDAGADAPDADAGTPRA
ncbi:hypothetical protein [Microbacterium aurum]|uniref:Uncharacterized protein n=1 Tax=Microbacterium aurum TaxID=36805 RepID=A0A1P8U9Z5_9MICO|nr:hypothetical protein [Microbacterium aurum]APZ34937.1 hypothetical protein BOH66_12300 [Microbacterium aurum]MBM7828868.1 hypothetical protein [Microbacterium aurum]